MAIPSELQLAMTILLALVLLTIWAAFFWGLVKVGTADGAAEWQTPPINREQVERENEQ
ncbi:MULTISPECIES: hypothetical protein [unclassified Haladaptatus]|uniref:hypothetical protein n=1 Tax=unclassified Haladaptatus TaxID=2622732 RepID=UPI0023E7F96B|nr:MULTISPECIES: hypothetical protein [unclassified Haladaptatus]